MKKGKFYIMMRNNVKKDILLKEVEGYIDTENKVGYHKNYDGWTVSDLATGLATFGGKTKKECIEMFEKHKEEVNQIRTTSHYKDMLSKYSQLVEIHKQK